MGSSSPSELTLDCKPHSYSMLLKSFGDLQAASSHHHDQTQNHTQKLEEFLSRLEEERLKIDAFKRELPLSMQLLTTAVEASRQQLQAFRANNEGPNRPVLEEFIPLKNNPNSHIEGSENTSNTIITSDKANWMTSAQLWSQASHLDTNNNNVTKPDHQYSLTSPNETSTDMGFHVSPKLALLDSKQHRPSSTTAYVGGGAFLPFSKDHRPNPTVRPLPELALASPDQKNNNNNNNKTAEILLEDKMSNSKSFCDSEGNKSYEQGTKLGNGTIHSSNMQEGQPTQANTAAATITTATNTSQSHRKARRCWSPDLHRRFVNALQMLGGSQVATPKQIRELMKVDGLTNDEVKSHLQKYRLHTRRPSPSPQGGGGPTPQLVVLGGIWVPPEYASSAHNGPTALYSPHPGSHAPTHYCATPVPQDYYATQPPPQQQLHHHTLHHQLHVYRTSTGSHTQSSPESDGRGAGGRSESIEDGKSDSSSWKGAESGGDQIQINNGGMAGRRSEDGGDSNGNQITLKF